MYYTMLAICIFCKILYRHRQISVARRAKLIYDAPTIINKSHGTVT